ncbi:hypothetical protein SAMN05443246_1758 [Paenibacillus sp. GP183]|nr:hypothetical protein SAMN05443246_1758 [Paenibacillus sp. GP183]
MRNDNSQKLLIRPFIQCNESLSGFLYRVSKMNNYRFSYLIDYLNLSFYEAQNNEFNQNAIKKLGDVRIPVTSGHPFRQHPDSIPVTSGQHSGNIRTAFR